MSTDPVSAGQARILFCHGSRDPAWRLPFERLVEEHRGRFPGCEVRLAFLEFMSPRLGDVIDELAGAGCGMIRIEPMFLAPGAHTRSDLPELVTAARRRWPLLAISIAPSLLESPATRQAIIDSLEPLASGP